MNSLQESSWLVKNKSGFQALEKRLLKVFQQLTEEDRQVQEKLYLDAFDWNLWRKSLQLVFLAPEGDQGARLELQKLDGELLETAPVAARKPPVFWWDLQASPLRKLLQKHLGVCSLKAWGKVQEDRCQLACRDEEGKILVRLLWVTQAAYPTHAEETPHHYQNYLTIQPLRGYEAAARKVEKCLASFLQEPLKPDSPEQLLLLCKLDPAAELLPQPLPLDPQAATETALRQAASLLFAQVRRYEAGLVADLDTEYLHQYRVNLRRIRSIFSLMKAALPSEVWLELKERLAQLARTTNQLRDLDVFLLDQQAFMALLPEAFRPGLQELFDQILVERNQEQKLLARYLLSEDYEKNCRWLDAFFNQPALLETPLATTPVAQTASRKIWKRYRRICRTAGEITATTPDEEVHELRIECKKLRYLLDFFASLYPPEQVARHLKSLKRLQTILGNFNDLTQQQAFLLERLERQTSSDLDAALHGLITLLYQQQLQERAKVMAALEAFAAPQMQADFKASYKE
ncbi:CHAD domain-containing protein [Marinospirillum perlucidum]|uniref:CHAD domain-containing protein n=1 Tax=Marinospirillum perlucidum TaxID=1982602 RepID=UPI000DF47134|nr:CHAD domain-containing protein [Marinospirillum perlucidum]